MEFRRKTVRDMGEWLKEEGFSDTVVEKFKGMAIADKLLSSLLYKKFTHRR